MDLVPQLGLTLSTDVLQLGADIVTYGFPLTDVILRDDSSIRFQLNARFLQGYVTRSFYYDHPGFGRTPSYELDMPAPEGLCGAPIIKLGTKEVVGVVFGSHDVAKIEQFSKVDLKTGNREVEIERVVSFALAHYTRSLWNLRGPATGGKTLGEFILKMDIIDI